MKSHVTKEFRIRLERLPSGVQEQAARAYIRWRKDPYHPGLDFKCVSQRQPIYSVRVSIDYRALGLRENDQMYWFWIGTHSEYDTISFSNDSKACDRHADAPWSE